MKKWTSRRAKKGDRLVFHHRDGDVTVCVINAPDRESKDTDYCVVETESTPDPEWDRRVFLLPQYKIRTLGWEFI